ncbi:MAG: endonuclease domain-containing protein [Candidatus Zixiibacteriota bacterium]
MKNKSIDKFDYLPYKRKLTKLARQNRHNPTPAEKKLCYEVLCRKQFQGYKFTRQKSIGGYIVDFYCSQLQLVIEIDGDSHAENVEYDKNRTEVLNQLGLRVLRYTNRDVCNNLEGVYQDLIQIVNPPTPLIRGAKKVKVPLTRGNQGVVPLTRGIQGVKKLPP